MIDKSTEDTRNQPIYSALMIYICTLLGGTLITGYMVSHNFKQLGQKKKVAPTWIICVLVSLLLVIVALYTPNMSFISDMYLSLALALATCFVVNKVQGKTAASYVAEGGATYKWTRGAIILGIYYSVILGIRLIVLLATVFFEDLGYLL